MLTREAWNALLKILEEPPPRVVFVFATTDPQKIAQSAAPVLSRLQRFDLKRIGPAEIRERLAAVLEAEQVPAEPEALAMIARAADGGLRDALSLTDQVLSLDDESAVTADRVREALGLVPEDEYLGILTLIAERRAGDVFATIGRLADAGVDLALFLAGLADMLRAQLAVALGGTAGDLSERVLARPAGASRATRARRPAAHAARGLRGGAAVPAQRAAAAAARDAARAPRADGPHGGARGGAPAARRRSGATAVGREAAEPRPPPPPAPSGDRSAPTRPVDACRCGDRLP